MPNNTILEGASGGRDENMISSFSVSYHAKSISEVTTVGESRFQGLVEQGRTWQALNDGTDGWIVTVNYKGYTEDKEPDPSETEQWNLGFDFSEEPIESHPNLKAIKETYGGYYEEPGGPLKFPEFMPKESKGKGGLGGKSKAKPGEKNPMFGNTTYAVMTARVTRTWSSKQIPKNAINDIGKVYSNIPGAPDSIADIDFGSRTWMSMPPKISQNGDVWRIENEWLLSPPSGWVEEVYEKASKQ
jgi:hypothetical protein